MMELWILRIVFLLVFHKLLYQCNCEILWNDLETECQHHLQNENSEDIYLTIMENCSVGSVIYDLSTEFRSGNLFFERNLNRRFTVKNDTGVIVVNDILDFESNPTEIIDLIVFNNTEGKITNVRLEVQILDVNEPPSWTMTFQPYKAQLTLDNDANDVVYRLSALDPENRTNTLVYGMFSDEYNLFNVNSKTGEISLKTRPSRSILAEDVLRITVTVKDNSQNRNAADIYFYTSSQPPQFALKSYTININEDIEVPAKLATVKARSFQSDGSISYSIIRQPDNIQHSIDEFGTVKVLSALDREYRTGYNILVKATDSLDQNTAAEIIVNIIDVNDNPPTFSHNVFTYLNVQEDHDIADPIGKVEISDPDADSNGTYYVSCNSSLFHVEQSGNVYSLHQLDYESHHQHRIQVTATDLRGRFSCSYFVITLQNIPDEKPIFSKRFYQFEVDRNATAGYHIGQVFAYHPNGNALTFTFKSGTAASPYFKIESGTGILSLVSSADALEPSCSMVVKAMESNLVRGGMDSTFEEVNVVIRTKDLNQHTPQFPNCSNYSHVHVTEEQMTGTFVLNVTAVDQDKGRNGEVEFSLSLNTDGSTAFKVETSSGNVGIIRTRQSLDHEVKSKYRITVIATDLAMEYQLRGTCTIDILVLDINDNYPKFDYSRYTRTLDRSFEVGTHLLTLQAEDPDFGGEVLHYSLVKPSSFFRLSSNGTVILKKNLQSWTTAEPLLIAQVTDSDDKKRTTEIDFVVVDKAHRLPTWNTYPFPEQTVSEDVGLNTIVFRVDATSAYFTSSLTYSIVRGLTPATNSLKTFDINAREVQVKSKLDYESVQTYKLKISVCDVAPTPNCNYMEVNVKVVNVNDNKPKFLIEGSLSVNIVEGPVKEDEIVLELEARDLDITGSSREVSYVNDCSGKDVDCDSFLMLSDGLIKPKKTAFDRETKAEYHLIVKTEDIAPTLLDPDLRPITINILDINDNTPKFTESSYSIEVSEDTVVDTILISISATDADTDKVEHLILGGTNIGAGTFAYKHGKFIVDSETGSIKLSSKLDFEDVQSYQLMYAATDGVHEVTTSLIINVTNINDEAPKFSQQMYEASVIEDTFYTEEILFTVQAIENVDPFGSIVFSLYGAPDGVFSIDSSTGEFKVNSQLDHEHKNEWKFLVVATDGDGAGLSSAVDIVIHVQDINDNAPMFLNQKYTGEIYEDRPVGSFVTRISATDDDEGEYSNLVYSLASTPPADVILQDALSGLNLFKVEPSGDISSLSVFDREVNSKYLIEVIATDIESNATGSCTVTINVLDRNDNEPTLVQDAFDTVISERVDIGYNVANIYAHDMDICENAQLSFSIVKDDASSFFVDVNPVNKQNGIVRVKKNLDYQIKSLHNISIDVTQAKFTRRVNVMVRLIDINDYIPKFAERSWDIAVSENTQIESNLLNVTATDSDPGFNGVIRYYISRLGTSSEMFAIHPVNGSLYLKEELDREKKDIHTIVIVARDQGSPSLSTTTTVNIHVLDVNDNGPLLYVQRKHVISETVTPPYEVVRIEAMDSDAPPNQGPFSFELICSDDGNVCSHFALIDQHDNTSILLTKTRLDSAVKSKYTIKVRIQDSGDPPQFSINSLTVVVIPEDSGSSIYIIIGACAAGVFILLICCCCVLFHKQRKRCSLRKSYDVAGYTQTYQSFTLGLRGGLLRVGNANEVEMHRRKLARRSLSESDHGMHGQNSFGMEINNLCLSDDKLTTLCEENEYIDRDLYRSDSSLDMVSTLSYSVETKTSKWVDQNRARTLRQHTMTDYSQPPPTFTFRTQHRVFTPTYV